MTTSAQKAFCVQNFSKFQSVTKVQRAFSTQYKTKAPTSQSIRRWCKQFGDTGSVQKGKLTGRPCVNNDTVNLIKQAFENNPVMSTNHASRQLGIPQSTIWKILRKTLKMKPFMFSVHQELKPDDKLARLNFCLSLQEKMAQNDDITSRLIFSDEACFHISGKVN